MLKVLFVTEKLDHYRVPLFNTLCSKIQLTISHGGTILDDCHFEQNNIEIKKYGPFIYFVLKNKELFDVIIFPNNVRVLNLPLELVRRKKYRLGLFGIGVAASYSRKYDEKSILSFARNYYIKKADFSIFYEQYPYVKYKAMGVDPNKLSIAFNTVVPNESFYYDKKKFTSFLFIGSLYRQKKIEDLLKAYLILYKENPQILDLEIVGNGDEFKNVENFIDVNNLNHKIFLHGTLISDQQLLPIMEKSVVCISPGQAGLSVQKCFSYGVGFITTRNAITGGESFSIVEGVNGDYYDGSISDLVSVMSKYINPEYASKISENSYKFYHNFRTVDIWRDGFLRNIL